MPHNAHLRRECRLFILICIVFVLWPVSSPLGLGYADDHMFAAPKEWRCTFKLSARHFKAYVEIDQNGEINSESRHKHEGEAIKTERRSTAKVEVLEQLFRETLDAIQRYPVEKIRTAASEKMFCSIKVSAGNWTECIHFESVDDPRSQQAVLLRRLYYALLRVDEALASDTLHPMWSSSDPLSEFLKEGQRAAEAQRKLGSMPEPLKLKTVSDLPDGSYMEITRLGNGTKDHLYLTSKGEIWSDGPMTGTSQVTTVDLGATKEAMSLAVAAINRIPKNYKPVSSDGKRGASWQLSLFYGTHEIRIDVPEESDDGHEMLRAMNKIGDVIGKYVDKESSVKAILEALSESAAK